MDTREADRAVSASQSTAQRRCRECAFAEDEQHKLHQFLAAAGFVADQVNHIRTLEDYRTLCTALGDKAKEVLEPEQFAKLMAGWRTIEFAAPD